MRATIRMIAEKAGVSIGTVDRVLHDRPYVKAEVRSRILEVMEELDYRPNRMASALATSGVHRRLAVIQPEWPEGIRSKMAEGVERFREEHGDYNLTLELQSYPQTDEAACLERIDRAVEQGAQAIALCAADSTDIRAKIAELAQQKIPVVTFNSDLPESERLCYVGEDAYRAGRVAGEIASKNLQADTPMLLVYAGPAYAGHKARADGFLSRLAERNLHGCCRVVATHEDYDETLQAVTEALREEPALRLIYMANQSVPACIEALKRSGKLGQVRVLSHDSDPDIQNFLRQGWVDFTINQDMPYQTYQALTVLFRYLTEHQQPKQDSFCPPSVILNAELL